MGPPCEADLQRDAAGAAGAASDLAPRPREPGRDPQEREQRRERRRVAPQPRPASGCDPHPPGLLSERHRRGGRTAEVEGAWDRDSKFDVDVGVFSDRGICFSEIQFNKYLLYWILAQVTADIRVSQRL